MPIGGLTKGLGKGELKVYVGSFAGPSSYPAGGFSVTVTGLSRVHGAVVIASGGYLAEVAGISGNTVTVRVSYFDYDASADGPAVEVPGGHDLSGVTFHIIVVGE